MEPLKSLGARDHARRALSLLEEFKNFALKGNVIDLAVGVIIGAAFAKIVDSLVKQIIMPLVSLLVPGEQGYLGWKLVVGAKEVPYGLFVGEVVNFVVIALVLYPFAPWEGDVAGFVNAACSWKWTRPPSSAWSPRWKPDLGDRVRRDRGGPELLRAAVPRPNQAR